MDKLLIIDDEGERRSVELEGPRVSVGRLASNDVALAGENVSRRHARLTRRDEAWSLEDLASYNGTTLNGAPLDAPTKLAHGDRFVVGDHTLVLLESGKPEPSIRVKKRREDDDTGDDEDTGDDFTERPPGRRSSAPPPDGFDEPPGTNEARDVVPAFRMLGTADELIAAAARAAVPLDVREMRLVFLEPVDAPAPAALERLPLVLGSGEGADVRVEGASLSPEHARLFVRDGRLWIEPLDPEASVEVSGERVPPEGRALGAGDAIRLADATARLARRHRFAPLPTPTRESEAPSRAHRPAVAFARPRDARTVRSLVMLAIAVVLVGAVLIAQSREHTPAVRAPIAAPAPDVAPTPLAAVVVATDAAVEPTPAQRLERAQQAMAEMDFAPAIASLAPLDARDDLPAAMAREVSLLETAALLATGEADRASRACARAVRLGFDPDHAPDQPPRVRAACRATRDAGAATPAALASPPAPASRAPRAPAPSSAPPSPTSPASRP